MKKLTLSHSACNKYMNCPKEYDYHYNERIRPTTKSSALLFGSAIDKAIETLIVTKSKTKAKDVFKKEFIEEPNIVYHEKDLDLELITQDQLDKNGPYYSLREKGIIMIDSFHEHMLPRIVDVLATQVDTTFESDNVDFKSIPDLICRLDDGQIYLLDIKTTSVPYDWDSVKKSTQLAAYKALYEAKYGVARYGYITLSKNIKKNRQKICEDCGFVGTGTRFKKCNNVRNGRCDGEWIESILPECVVTLITDTISDDFANSVMYNVSVIAENIAAGKYHKNFNACKRGKESYCDFYGLCHKGTMQGLEYKPK